MTRMPVVAGRFYEGTFETLTSRLNDCFLKDLGPGRLPEGDPGSSRRIKALISPHAGYMYSGMTAAHNYLRLFEDGRPDHIVILGPNHTGWGARLAVCDEDWQTPLGIVRYDTELGSEIMNRNDFVTADRIAHSSEHSIEVQLPFLQFIFGEGLSFVPISMMDQTIETCSSIAKTLAELATDMDILVIASSDFTHFESSESAKKKDNQAMDFLEFLDPEGFLNFVQSHRVSICGAGPITASILFAKEIGAVEYHLLKYTNSGDITGDNKSVVAYVSAEIV
ncbi:MAG: AmmeMemoRadiSam system protein B [Candidatus Thorarchaeota archaeon]